VLTIAVRRMYLSEVDLRRCRRHGRQENGDKSKYFVIGIQHAGVICEALHDQDGQDRDKDHFHD